jgi:hypothetical protein
MSTVINNPRGSSEESSGVGAIVGVVIALLLVALFFIYFLPMIQNQTPATTPNTEIQVNIPNPPAAPSVPAPATPQ